MPISSDTGPARCRAWPSAKRFGLSGTGLSRILLGAVLFGHKTNTACEVGKKARLARGRFVRRTFQGKPRSSGLIPARRTQKPRILEFFQIRQVAQRLEPELEQKLLRRHVGVGRPEFRVGLRLIVGFDRIVRRIYN